MQPGAGSDSGFNLTWKGVFTANILATASLASFLVGMVTDFERQMARTRQRCSHLQAEDEYTRRGSV